MHLEYYIWEPDTVGTRLRELGYDLDMDKLNAGGKNAMLAFLKENSDVVRSYLQ